MIAFAYANMHDALAPIYRACADGLVANIREVMPQERVLHITDDETEPVRGCDVLRVKRKVGLMSWRLLGHCMAHGGADEILFTEPDVRFNCNVMDVFKDAFDVTVCGREFRTSLKGVELTDPYTFGMNFSRSGDFWKDTAKYCLTLSPQEQVWGGDMKAVAHVVKGGAYRVKELDAAIFNHVPATMQDKSGNAVHYKGKRKTWLFPQVAEAA